MTFKTACEYYPIGTTLVGNYGQDGTITIPPGVMVDDVETWDECPLEWSDGSAFPFIYYNPEGIYECWYFCFERVSGYINQSDDSDGFYPATHTQDFGWEIVDPDYSEWQILKPDDELAIELGWPLDKLEEDYWMRELAAYRFDTEAYLEGKIFTTFESFKKFVRENNKE